jgi:hypothetical protein
MKEDYAAIVVSDSEKGDVMESCAPEVFQTLGPLPLASPMNILFPKMVGALYRLCWFGVLRMKFTVAKGLFRRQRFHRLRIYLGAGFKRFGRNNI